MRPGAAVLLALLAGGCGGGTADAGVQDAPALPPLRLRPMQGELERAAAGLAAPATEEEQRELREMADIALQVVEADGRMRAMIERELLAHPSGWWPLEQALEHEDAAVRSRAAWLCGRSEHGILQLPLLLRLKYELDPEAILWVAEALFQLGNDAGLGWLDAAMTREQTAQRAGLLAIDVCRAAGVALPDEPSYVRLQEELRALTARWGSQGTGAREGAPAVDPAALAARVAAHLAVTAGTQLRPVDDARFVLTRTGVLAIGELQDALAAEEPYLRTMVLQVLTEIGPPARAAGAAIVPLLGDPLTAAYAVRALGEIGCTEALPHLRPLLRSPELELRAAAAGALGVLGDEVSRAELGARLGDPQEAMDVRVQAAFALSLLGDEAARAFLAERERQSDYHAPTLRLLLDRLAARGG